MKRSIIILSVLFSCGNSLYDNIDKVSNDFKDKPYINNPLGENKGIDKDPLYRYDAFDCQTYVETVLALSLTKDEEDFKKLLTKIRYKEGEILFEKRNHFVNPDWIRNNEEYVKDITYDISHNILNEEPKEMKTLLDRKNWFKQNYNIEVKVKKEEISIEYITLDKLLLNKQKFIDNIKEPLIVNFVINNPKLKEEIGTDIDISHIAFIIPKDNSLILRHASLKQKKVVDIDFFDYIEWIKKYPMYIGINFLEIKT